jgi:glycosyltransferase involved in cell wall biosynthesis
VDEAVDSALAQTHPDLEVVVVDDGSTDPATAAKLAAYDRPRTRVVRTANQGLAAARNNGIRAAEGSLILPLDADDRIAPTYVQKAVDVMEKSPGVGIVSCLTEYFGGMSGVWPQRYAFPQILLGNRLSSCALFRKRDWEAVGGYTASMRGGWEDYDFWIALIERGAEVVQIPEPLFFYRRRAGSMVERLSTEDRVALHTQICLRHKKLFSDHVDAFVRDLNTVYACDEELRARVACLEPLAAELEAARAEAARLRVELAEALRRVEEERKLNHQLTHSVSWEVTGPLRAARRAFGRLRGEFPAHE